MFIEPHAVSDFLRQRLASRTAEGNLRTLSISYPEIDFCSNDYLGFARCPVLQTLIHDEWTRFPEYPTGGTGSRLISGNSAYLEALETELSAFFNGEDTLLFNSGYDANLAFFSCLPQKGDTVICDELIHASVIDGVRLSMAHRFTFAHNDPESLREKIGRAKGRVFVSVESVYSMDGDRAPLEAMLEVCESQGAVLIVDEAHATGLFGRFGEGLVAHAGLSHRVFARVHTFGKALGCHGAAIVGPNSLKQFLINFARPFIYTTAMPFHLAAAVKMALSHLKRNPPARATLAKNIAYFMRKAQELGLPGKFSDTAIQTVFVKGNDAVKKMSEGLITQGFHVYPVCSPTVAICEERIRITLHSYNTSSEIEALTTAVEQLL